MSAKAIEQQVQELYVAYFARAADPAGLAYWSKLLEANPGAAQLAGIAANFAASAEYKNMYAQGSTALKVGAVYEHLFGRAAEPAGLAYWSALLDAQLINIDKVVTIISQAARGADFDIFHDKVDVAQAISAAIDTPYEVRAYASPDANQKVTAYIAQVKDAASYAAAIAPQAIEALIASLGPDNTGPLPPPTSAHAAGHPGAPLDAGLIELVGTLPAALPY